jgi:ATP-binding cassette subfamily B protein
MQKFPHYNQHDQMDCGPACLRIIAKFYGKNFSQGFLRDIINTNKLGSDLGSISEAAENLGFKTLGVRVNWEKLSLDAPLPCIIHWNSNHFAVLYKVKKNKVYISDPACGLIQYTKEEFLHGWLKGNEKGIALLLDPLPQFFEQEPRENETGQYGFNYLLKYLRNSKKFIFQLIIGLFAGSILQIALPFLTQSIVDIGIKTQDISFVYLILFAQLMLFFGRTSIEIIRRWILLHLGTRINILAISDFFLKLMKLPIAFFDRKMTGDLLQRIQDHKRLERLITSTSLNTIFSSFTLVVFALILAFYHFLIFLVFAVGTLSYFSWVLIFMKRRKHLDYKQFAEVSAEQSKVIELINGMQEIKLNNAERKMRWGWEDIQARLFKVSLKRLTLEQLQTVGSSSINEIKNIFIIFIAAQAVIAGEMTLGMMMAVSYIIGQLNAPVTQLVDFMYSLQDAKTSVERLGEIHSKKDEESDNSLFKGEFKSNEDIEIESLKYKYPGSKKPVLNNISFKIPANKVTAIVGVSGSGKTTLMKLLLGFYEPEKGKIKIGGKNLKDISPSCWRSACGVVMQEGYIFNCSIEDNIAIGEEIRNRKKVAWATEIANIKEFIESTPHSYTTQIGAEGLGLSTGQKQRILLSRAIYKNPSFFFLDEATSALDANNETTIMKNLAKFFEGKTVVIIAHRLSTVKNADQIIVMDEGKIVEKGTHQSLIDEEGAYFNLVKNQLELEKLTTQYEQSDLVTSI